MFLYDQPISYDKHNIISLSVLVPAVRTKLERRLTNVGFREGAGHDVVGALLNLVFFNLLVVEIVSCLFEPRSALQEGITVLLEFIFVRVL